MASLSVLTPGILFELSILFTVPTFDVFHPPPKVDSAVIRLRTKRLSTNLDCDENLFKRVVKAGFGKRRKTLRNALKEINLPEAVVDLELLNCRAEQLTVAEFISLTSKITSGWKH